MLTELLGGGLKMLSGRSDTENPQRWFTDFINGGNTTSSGEHITEKNALRVTPVKCAISVLAESMQTLPIEIMRQNPKSGTRSRATDHPVQELFFRQVNDEMSSAVWKNTTQMHLGLWGNSYSRIVRTMHKDRLPVGLSLLPAEPERTKPVRGADGKIRYEIHDEHGRRGDDVPAKDMLHMPYLSLNGVTGQSPIQLLREAIGGNKAAERFANEMFKNGGTPQGFFTHPGVLSEPAHARLKKALAENAEHGNRHGTQILEEAMRFEPSAMEPEKVQMTEARLFLVSEICRIYRITPHLLQDLTHGTFTNVAELGRQFITYTMMPWMNLWSGEINRKLLEPPYFARFNPMEFLRGDPAELAAWLKTMFMIGGLSVNEIRGDQGQDPLSEPNADEHFVPLNMVPLSKATDAEWVKGKGGENNDEKPGGVPGGDGVTPNDATMAAKPSTDETIALAKVVIDDTFRRMSRIEANAANRAARQPETFTASLDKFWPAHRDRLIDALTLPMKILASLQGFVSNPTLGPLSVDDEIAASADEQIERHHAELLTAAECKPSELADRVAAAVESWTSN